jgi:hypothetical protein
MGFDVLDSCSLRKGEATRSYKYANKITIFHKKCEVSSVVRGVISFGSSKQLFILRCSLYIRFVASMVEYFVNNKADSIWKEAVVPQSEYCRPNIFVDEPKNHSTSVT